VRRRLSDSSAAEREAAFAALDALTPQVFVTEQTGAGLAAAAIKNFVWQVKRKLTELPVTNHLMLAFISPQGSGKSSLL
jgi:hypothetical protein